MDVLITVTVDHEWINSFFSYGQRLHASPNRGDRRKGENDSFKKRVDPSLKRENDFKKRVDRVDPSLKRGERFQNGGEGIVVCFLAQVMMKTVADGRLAMICHRILHTTD